MSESGKLVGSRHRSDYGHDFRTCKKCGVRYPLTEACFPLFFKKDATKNGFRWECRWCRRKYNAASRIKNGTHHRSEEGRLYRETYKEAINAKRRATRKRLMFKQRFEKLDI